MSIIQSLNWRYATKMFDPTQKISDAYMGMLLEALRLTPSSFGLQFWKFLVVTNQDIKNKLVEHSWGQKQVADCSHLLVFCKPAKVTAADVDRYVSDIAKTRGVEAASLEGYANMMKGYIENTTPEVLSAWMDKQLYIALGVLHTVCAELKIDSCPMEGFSAAAYDEVLDLPAKGLKSVVVCPVGYRSADDKYALAKKVRYPVEDVVEWIR